MATANLAWVAWRLGNVDESREKSLEALELWRSLPLSYPFCWAALLPLIGVSLTKQQVAEAVEYTQMLLLPDQQRLPDVLTTALETAIQAWDANQPESARLSFEKAIAVAQETTYL